MNPAARAFCARSGAGGEASSGSPATSPRRTIRSFFDLVLSDERRVLEVLCVGCGMAFTSASQKGPAHGPAAMRGVPFGSDSGKPLADTSSRSMTDFLGTSDGLELVRAFMAVKMRRSVVGSSI